MKQMTVKQSWRQPSGCVEWPELRVRWEQPSSIPDLEGRRALLSQEERDRVARLHRGIDRANAVAAWSLVRLMLSMECGIDPRRLRFERTCFTCGRPGHGKPRVSGMDCRWHFSLSHAEDRVVVALSSVGPVGVDVESTRSEIDDLAALVLHASEPPVAGEDLLRVWTRKEALLKATGEGLARPMSHIDLTTEAPRFLVRDIACGDGYVCSVALGLARMR
jgi:4'-phosphopantetheinyl transferase